MTIIDRILHRAATMRRGAYSIAVEAAAERAAETARNARAAERAAAAAAERAARPVAVLERAAAAVAVAAAPQVAAAVAARDAAAAERAAVATTERAAAALSCILHDRHMPRPAIPSAAAVAARTAIMLDADRAARDAARDAAAAALAVAAAEQTYAAAAAEFLAAAAAWRAERAARPGEIAAAARAAAAPIDDRAAAAAVVAEIRPRCDLEGRAPPRDRGRYTAACAVVAAYTALDVAGTAIDRVQAIERTRAARNAAGKGFDDRALRKATAAALGAISDANRAIAAVSGAAWEPATGPIGPRPAMPAAAEKIENCAAAVASDRAARFDAMIAAAKGDRDRHAAVRAGAVSPRKTDRKVRHTAALGTQSVLGVDGPEILRLRRTA